MSPKLKPLLLPQLVEQRKMLEAQAQQDMFDADQTYIYYTHHSSSSDLAAPSPVTPTFSRSGYSRNSGSTSSLEQMSPLCDQPVSPTQIISSAKGSKSQLPDVQEEPLREDEDTTNHHRVYGCLCEQPCPHRSADSAQMTIRFLGTDVDYDLGFLSDGDINTNLRAKRKRNGSESTFAGWSRHLSSRLPTLTRWRSMSFRNDLAFSATTSDPEMDQQRPSLSRVISRAASSRSSSISAHGCRAAEHGQEQPPPPPTPSLSMYESTDSIVLPSTFDEEDMRVREDIQRHRALAATPLLPPLLTDNPPTSVPASLQPSPLQSPKVAPSTSVSASHTPEALPPHMSLSPPLSTKPSVSSFRPAAAGPLASVTSPTSEPFPLFPNMLEHDSWSDRLGHANFTIEPRPYRPAVADTEALELLHAHWDSARVNYTKHLVRTGEHYGTTSNTYALTQAKWAEIEREWHMVEDSLVETMVQNGNDEASLYLRQRARDDSAAAGVPHILEAEGKFPERGDMDIVGPMQRDASMLRDGPDDKKNVSIWLRNLAGKVGLRK